MRKGLLIVLLFTFYNNKVKCQDTIQSFIATETAPFYFAKKDTLYFDKPNLIKTLSYIPSDMFGIAKAPFVGKNWVGLSVVTASTILLTLKDQEILNWVKKASSNIGLSPDTKYHDALKFGKTRVIKIPQNLNSALYQLGEGGTSMVVAGGLFIYSKINNDWRAEQTAYDLTETFAAMGVTTQILKRISGRESPFKATVPGGRWSPLPSFNNYQTHTSSYDAFPSGHLATMVATVTVLTNNYPEKRWIKPLGISLIGLTSWAMLNTEVHWISDYPLAIAIGYLSGKLTTMRHNKQRKPDSKRIII